MSEYPTRAIVSEAFVNQMETIEKTLIEVQNQPSSYYGRRNRRDGSSPQTLGSSYSKYGFFPGQAQGQQPQSQVQANMGMQSQIRTSQPQMLMGQDYYGYRQERNSVSGQSSGMGMAAHVTRNTHVPQVFEEDKYLSASSTGSYSSGGSKLLTFDPFSESGDLRGNFQPLFNSSNSILGANFASNSNIWGDTNKTMTDAAVWG